MNLKDKAILVTGSTTGIGKAIAKRCLDSGASVLIHGLEPGLAEETWSELDPERERSDILIADLLEPDTPERLRAAMMDRFGKIDGLVNNAAMVGTGKIETTEVETFDRFMAVNVRAPLFLIKAMLPELERAGGCVVNMR